MRRIAASFGSRVEQRVHRVTSIADIATEWEPSLRFLVLVESDLEKGAVQQLRDSGLAIDWVQSPDLMAGDVITCQVNQSRALILFRETDVHHSLLTTNRCNSYCLMCSQPPTPQDDGWLVDEALDVIRHIRVSPRALGLSGGEPLLLGKELPRLLESISSQHPNTSIEILTNARLLASMECAGLLPAPAKTTWLIPLYGPVDFLHDFVVQSSGAFEETIAGLLLLQEHQQPVQLRIVLIEPVLESLVELCHFIGRNLPFVREVALMACEPTGFALANRDVCEVDLLDWTNVLGKATEVLGHHRVPYLFMNTPLCALPKPLWPAAHQSISDWKNVFAAECGTCCVKPKCSGLFAWHEAGWKPTKIRPILEEIVA